MAAARLLSELADGSQHRVTRVCHPTRTMMDTSAEICWRLSKACGQWAVESRDSAARIAFRQMGTAWARLAFDEEFTGPLDERIDPPTAQKSEATPVGILASALAIVSA